MHILLIHQAFVSPREPGGTRHYELARHLVKQGHEITIIASKISYLTGQHTSFKRTIFDDEKIGGIRIVRVYTYPALHRSFWWRIVSFISFMLFSVIGALRIPDIDLVMGTSPPIFQAVSAWLVSAIHRRPFLLEIRDLWPDFAIDMGVLKNSALIYLSHRMERFLYDRSSHLLINSPAYKEHLLKYDIAEAKIDLIPNGVDPDAFNPDSDGQQFRRKWGWDNKFIVTYAGALGLANDIGTILKAAENLHSEPDIQFLVVGDGKERKNLEKYARQLKLTNITFLGSRPKSEMSEILAASNACLATLADIPMFRTTYPNKVFDYMAAGRPTILGIDGVIRQVMDAANGGIFVAPGNAEHLANAVRMLCRDRNYAAELGNSARNYVVQHFNRCHQSQEFLNLVQQVIKKSNMTSHV